MPEIIEQLEKNNIKAERKSLYDDISALSILGFKIEKRKRNQAYYYYLSERDFSTPELSLLVDAVRAAKFITPQKSADLIEKLCKLASVHESENIIKAGLILNHGKAINESVYNNTEVAQNAINQNKKIRFKYFEWRIVKRKRETHIKETFKHKGKYYIVSPWKLVWENDKYYLISYDEDEDIIKHFRVDKMIMADIIDKPREGREKFVSFNLPDYLKKNFEMFSGESKMVCMEFDTKLLGIVIERYGREVQIQKRKKNKFRIEVNVNISQTFYSWLFKFGRDVKIISPKSVEEEYLNTIKSISELYK